MVASRKVVKQRYLCDDHAETPFEGVEVKEEEVELALDQFVPHLEHYGKEFMWETGSTDIREFALWLKQRL